MSTSDDQSYRPTSPDEISPWELLHNIARAYEHHWHAVANAAGAPDHLRDEGEVRERCVDLLVAISALAQRATSQRWPRAVDALNNGASWERVARALGLTPDEMTVGLQTWLDLQRTYGELDGDHLDDLLAHLPHGCPLVGVELDERAVPLDTYAHPLRALYLLGAEDDGLPPAVLARCHEMVQVPSPSPYSLNVAVAGSITIAHRYWAAVAAEQANPGSAA